MRPLLLPYEGAVSEGAVSQVYVLDLPLSDLEYIIGTFCRFVDHPVLSTVAGYTVPEHQAPICDAVSRVTILETISQNANSIISGRLSNDRSLRFWITPNFEDKTFDAELLFWADEFFRDDMTEIDKVNSFGAVHSIAEKFRDNSPKSECVLSSHPAGNPRHERDQPHTVFW